MKTLADLVAFIDLVLTPGFDVAAAEARLGPIERWIGGVAYVKDTDPALYESAIETFDGKFSGVQTNLRNPIEIPWSDLERTLGEPEENIYEVDNFTGRVTYTFERQVAGARGDIYLYALRGQEPARIEVVIVRPSP
jgi:hypothetical protein